LRSVQPFYNQNLNIIGAYETEAKSLRENTLVTMP
jgi:hypothetical protein